MASPFIEKLLLASRANNSLLCIGLDPDPGTMPNIEVFSFNKAIIDATSDLVCAFKPNFAFYEALGLEGITALKQTVDYVPKNIPIIADAKRGDVGNTAKAYATALFDTFGFDAATVNPFLGRDSLQPFLEREDKGVFILCRTSNPGAADLQDLILTRTPGEPGSPLFEIIARLAAEWNSAGNIGLVVGATYPKDLKRIRDMCPDMPFLIPGIGPQGGDLAAAVSWGTNLQGDMAIISSSRQVLYASRGSDFAQAARKTALHLRSEINRWRSSGVTT
ncbi:MAG: orotidine-5'-phosphate decarboxylase [Chloroflexi bacterium]|nr:orotidine-5'-phosphate decarboxylase [Chloroflexota bacterium]